MNTKRDDNLIRPQVEHWKGMPDTGIDKIQVSDAEPIQRTPVVPPSIFNVRQDLERLTGSVSKDEHALLFIMVLIMVLLHTVPWEYFVVPPAPVSVAVPCQVTPLDPIANEEFRVDGPPFMPK